MRVILIAAVAYIAVAGACGPNAAGTTDTYRNVHPTPPPPNYREPRVYDGSGGGNGAPVVNGDRGADHGPSKAN